MGFFRKDRTFDRYIWKLQGEVVRTTNQPNYYLASYPKVYEGEPAPICECCECEKEDSAFYKTEWGSICGDCLTEEFIPGYDPDYNVGCWE